MNPNYNPNNLNINATNQPSIPNPSMSFSGHIGRQGNLIGYGGQPPSRGDVRPGVLSNPSGGNYYATGQPPSHKDVRPIETSQNGSSITENPAADRVAALGMSMTAPHFKMNNPYAFQKTN